MCIPENTLNIIITSIVSSLSNCLLIGNSAEQSVYHMCLTEFGALHIVVQYGLRDKDHRILRWPYYYMRELFLVRVSSRVDVIYLQNVLFSIGCFFLLCPACEGLSVRAEIF